MTILNGQPIDPPPGTRPVVAPGVTSSAVPPTPASTEDDGVGMILGITALFLGFFFPLAGFVVGIVALSRARRAGHKNPMALAGLIVGLVLTVLIVVLVVVGIVWGVGLFSTIFNVCQQLGNGTHHYNGVTYNCNV